MSVTTFPRAVYLATKACSCITSCSSNFLALVCSQIVAVSSLSTKQVSRATCTSTCMLWHCYCYHSCSFSTIEGSTRFRYRYLIDLVYEFRSIAKNAQYHGNGIYVIVKCQLRSVCAIKSMRLKRAKRPSAEWSQLE